MRSDQVFVLLLIILIPMTGCFDNSVGDAEGSQDSDSNSDPVTGESTGTENPTTGANDVQSRTWFSSGGTYHTYWNDGQEYQSGQQRCVDWGPAYNSSTGEYMGEDCRDFGYPEAESDWNTTNCTERGGEITWSTSYYRTAPSCSLSFATITTSPGEAILIYEISGASITSVCNGVSQNVHYLTNYLNSGKEYAIMPGSALNCTFEISQTLSYTSNGGYYSDYPDMQSMWSVVYAIQDTTVV